MLAVVTGIQPHMGAGTGDPGHGDSGATLSMACSVPDAQQAIPYQVQQIQRHRLRL